jgi:hypothetical protein
MRKNLENKILKQIWHKNFGDKSSEKFESKKLKIKLGRKGF